MHLLTFVVRRRQKNMNKSLALANRSLKEVLRDFINVFFGIAFPILLLGMSYINTDKHTKKYLKFLILLLA